MSNLTNLMNNNITKSTIATNEEATMNTTKQLSINIQELNKSALVSTIAAEVFHQGLSPTLSLVVATAFIGAVDYLEEDFEDFMEVVIDGLTITMVEVVNATAQPEDERNLDTIFNALRGANYITDDAVGPRLAELANLRQEGYAPVLASEGIHDGNRRFGYAKTKYSPLFVEFIHALESCDYTVDDATMSLALQVQAKTGGEEKDDEGYVLRGCAKMDSSLAYNSEFKGDTRGRGYHASCLGPNGQSSDRSRALMNLVGVPTDYDVKTVKKHILAEIEDMTGDVRAAVAQLKELGEVDFIIANLGDGAIVKKPWSFVKAAKIMRELQAGKRPYIGMAVGLDAKCSGPQLGSLMVGDQQIAAACGFTLTQLEDAYQLAIVELEKAGFMGLTRNGIKKAYMGVFYGQGWRAFTDTTEIGTELTQAIYQGGPVNEGRAEAFHKALSAAFGAKMVGVRQLFKSYAKKIDQRIKHFMPDGFEVAMNYKNKVNALGELMEYDTEAYDVRTRNNAETFKFINFQLKTRDVNVGDFARNGFVNMIQAVDALIARLICVHLKRLGAKHIISVHDCFRVNVTEMHLLEQAIKLAYMDLFGSRDNVATQDLPLGTDILGMYFTGANKALINKEEAMMVSQFFTSGKRRMLKVNGVAIPELINALGTSYYFAK